MGNNAKLIKNNIALISIVLLSTIIIIIMSTQKINYHIDELLTYSLSNSTSYININPGETYDSYGQFQESFLSTSVGTKFDYKNVWRNQANDVHPPFYYAIIHTISSFMPGEFSKYIGIGVNILFNALIILILYKFTLLLTNNKAIAYITGLFWAINPGIISDMMFIRMYIMTMFFCLLISFIHIKYIHSISTKNYKFFLTLFAVSLAGALTHYYFIVFTFFICSLFVLVLLYRKRFKELFIYICTYLLTIITVLIIFPSIYKHILGGGSRGEESIDNLINMNGYLHSIKFFWNVISKNLFGGYLLFFVIVICIAFITNLLRKKRISKVLNNQFLFKIVFLLIACSLYFLLISKIAIYSAERYLQPIFPVVILIFVSVVFQSVKLYFSKKVSIFIVCTMLFLISINGYIKTTSFEYLILNSEKAVEIAEKYSNKNSIYIYDKTWKIPTNYVELSHYKSVTFYNMKDLESLYQNTDNSDFVVYIHSKDKLIINSIVKKLPNIETYKKLNNYGYCHVYYLE
ncbi:Dolichyl-phosphate-mannose-protein mannosyltransferase [Salinibacillus kushneri]|uniref:Dolichyl-phosphate-mannose-protein mannosyltransferase n=1 Tax=Salinibacillus kushneri TaxID=237682 RepID=A0A1I0JIN6_9BACI|nr:phospholipid carrier-dependent glycosyltransferase [Salinibacillus kushneri]SEU09404.1 Dolichyl-phosphate-mannose-protein mannosyltransferase [Salinibacillus kushneri]